MQWSGEVKEGGGWRIFPEDGEKLPGRKKKVYTIVGNPKYKNKFSLGKKNFLISELDFCRIEG